MRPRSRSSRRYSGLLSVDEALLIVYRTQKRLSANTLLLSLQKRLRLSPRRARTSRRRMSRTRNSPLLAKAAKPYSTRLKPSSRTCRLSRKPVVRRYVGVGNSTSAGVLTRKYRTPTGQSKSASWKSFSTLLSLHISAFASFLHLCPQDSTTTRLWRLTCQLTCGCQHNAK